ncbi:MAG: uroporphyrinogen-III C-methyltransferase [Gammaproteobacteria bacterium]|nr:uroporphyrinogen-III C-methyltransferase [Gammaproteobacteria bacterium]
MADPDKKISPEIVESKPANDSQTIKSSSGKGIIFLLLIIIAGLTTVGGYYLWQQQLLLETKLQTSNSSVTSQLNQLDQSSQLQQQSLQTQQNLIDELNQKLQETNTLSQQAIEITNRAQRDWVLAEIDYLLRIANRRLQIARDINGAIAALDAADQRLFNLGDLTYFEIRKLLSADIAKLKALHQADINGVALALDQMIYILEFLPFKGVQEEVKTQLEPDANTQTKKQPEGFVDTVLDTVMNIGDIKIHQRSIQPASSAQQQQEIEQLLRNFLLSSRLAVLRYDDKQFSHDIEQALQLLHLHYKADDNRVNQMSDDLLKFKNLNLMPDLPDINKSWKLLQQINQKIKLELDKQTSATNKSVEVL